MTFFISHLHSDLRGTRLTKRGATNRPDEVPRGLHKSYRRMEAIRLPAPVPLKDTLQSVLEKRRSYDGGTENGTLSLEQCGTLLGHALGQHPESLRRHYPSGGALYPIETYLITTALEHSSPAVFHYNPTAHVIERLWDLPAGLQMKDLARHPEDLFFSSMLVFTGVWKRSSAKYGDFTYTVGMLEAGHMSENVLLVATALGLKSRPMAGFEDGKLIELLDLDPEEEQPVHSIVLT